MLRIVRSYYQVGTIGITGVAAAIGSTLQSGDVLYMNTTAQIYGTIVGSALVYATS